MSDLPAGWAFCSVRDIAESINPGFASGRHNSASEGVPHLRPMNVSRLGVIDLTEVKSVSADAGAKRLRRGDILFNNTNSPELVGKSATFDLKGDFAFSNHMTCVRPVAGVNAAFLGRQIHYRWMSGELRRFISNHVNQASISSGRLADEVPLVLPPVAEQERIVTAIEEAFSKLDAGEAALRATRQRLKRLRESVLAAAVTGRLVPQDPTDEPASKLLAHLGTAPCDSAGLPELPHSWEWARLGAMGEVVGGVTKDAKRQDDPDFVEVPYLRVANVQRGFLDLGTVATIRVSAAAAQKLALVDGDVLFNEGGDRDKLGRGWVWQGQVPGCIHQNHVFRSRLAGGMQPKLVSWWGNTFGKGWFEAHGKQTTNLASLNITTVKSFPVPVAPVNEQERIVAAVEYHVSFIDACERTVDLGLVRSAAMRRSILKAAFEGRLVPQDPSDERASVLLDRIEAERDAVGKVPKPHRTLKPQALTPTVGPIADRA